MTVWLVISADFEANPLSTDGSRRFGGRWNPPGVAILYSAGTEALAYLERFVHIGPELKDAPHLMLRIDVPDEGGLDLIEERELPRDWKAVPIPAAVQDIGQRWVKDARCLALSVPSALSGSDRNILLNAAHPAYGRVLVVEKRPFVYDPRMWKHHEASEPHTPRRHK